jgi:menaquinone-dependent protoporphyrinogen oxidase
MRIFIAYATIEGQTHRIARHILDFVESHGHQGVLVDVSDMSEYTLERPDGVIVCAPIHVGKYPAAFVDFVHREIDWLNDNLTAFVSVTLSIRSEIEDERAEARAFPVKFAESVGWEPARVHNAAGALRYTEYDFFKRWMLRRISKLEGGPVDTKRNHELTDWVALDTFVVDFLTLCAMAHHPPEVVAP